MEFTCVAHLGNLKRNPLKLNKTVFKLQKNESGKILKILWKPYAIIYIFRTYNNYWIVDEEKQQTIVSFDDFNQ